MKKKKKTIVMVTHDIKIALQCRRTITVKDGKVVNDVRDEGEKRGYEYAVSLSYLSNLNSTKLRSCWPRSAFWSAQHRFVAMISGGQLASYQALQQFKALGTDLMSITINTRPAK